MNGMELKTNAEIMKSEASIKNLEREVQQSIQESRNGQYLFTNFKTWLEY
jgi:hypothetical protein